MPPDRKSRRGNPRLVPYTSVFRNREQLMELATGLKPPELVPRKDIRSKPATGEDEYLRHADFGRGPQQVARGSDFAALAARVTELEEALGLIQEIQDVSPRRIATSVATTVSTIVSTTETAIDSVTASLVAGRKYRIRYVALVDSANAGVRIISRIRENNASGTVQASCDAVVSVATGSGYSVNMETEYNATSTESKTFVATIIRGTGAGDVWAHGTNNIRRYLYVDEIGPAS